MHKYALWRCYDGPVPWFAHFVKGLTATHGDRNPQYFYDGPPAGYRTKLRRSAGYGDHAFFHVGIPYLPERHSGSAPEIDFRPELRGDHADPVRVFWSLLPFLHSLCEAHLLDWLQALDGGGTTHHGAGGVLVRAS